MWYLLLVYISVSVNYIDFRPFGLRSECDMVLCEKLKRNSTMLNWSGSFDNMTLWIVRTDKEIARVNQQKRALQNHSSPRILNVENYPGDSFCVFYNQRICLRIWRSNAKTRPKNSSRSGAGVHQLMQKDSIAPITDNLYAHTTSDSD